MFRTRYRLWLRALSQLTIKKIKKHISSGGSIMTGNPRLAVLDKFIRTARTFCAANPDTEARMKKICSRGRWQLRELICHQSWWQC
jgi:hypothetical protein